MAKYLNEIQEWITIRDQILNRDNYTCQRCKDFNPQLGTVEIVSDDESYVEFHEYESSPVHSLYRISSQKTGLTIELEFDTDWLVLPVLQIHHKRYINGRKIWEYEHDDLVTLCKNCHTYLHLHEEIPVYNEDNVFLYLKKIVPEDYSSGRNHNYKSWIFIKQDDKKDEYQVTGVDPRVSYIVFEHQEPSEIAKLADSMIADFSNKFLPLYKPKNYSH